MSNIKQSKENDLTLIIGVGIMGYGILAFAFSYILRIQKDKDVRFIVITLIVFCTIIMLISLYKAIKILTIKKIKNQ